MEIIWSKKATYSFHKIKNYIEQFWSPNTAKKFIKDVLRIISLLENNPLLGNYNANLDCRKIVISKHVSLYYEVKENRIDLITFFNNRQKPIKIIN